VVEVVWRDELVGAIHLVRFQTASTYARMIALLSSGDMDAPLQGAVPDEPPLVGDAVVDETGDGGIMTLPHPKGSKLASLFELGRRTAHGSGG
jgi:hypothetical protein